MLNIAQTRDKLRVLCLLVPEWFRQERDGPHLFCWFVIFFCCGVILFFNSSGGSALIWPLACVIISLAGSIFFRTNWCIFPFILSFFAICAGFLTGVVRLKTADMPVLQRTTISVVTGYIETVDYRDKRSPHLVIMPRTMTNLVPEKMPRRIRVTLRSGDPPPAGTYISAKMRLLPLPQPVRPSGYDFARDAYFGGLGAVGSVLGKMTILESKEAISGELWLFASIDRARNALTQRIYESIGGEAGGVAASLVTGKRGYIPDDTNDVLRAAGIYHIVSISGLHMVIAAGLVFWTIRALLALSENIALRWPIKKIAAGAAMLGAIAYCVFSGASVSTIRSLIMTLIMLGAILAGRRALSMRNLALAALLIVVLMPEALLTPSFQMSFAAVMALIPLAQIIPRFMLDIRGGFFSKTLRHSVNWFIALVATTLVAGLATGPIAAYHFQTAVPFGLIGNALALPLVSLIVMPMGALGAIAYPFSLDEPVWVIMGMATKIVVDVSRWVASLEGALLHMPAFSSFALVMAVLALIIMTIATTPLRYIAVIPLLISGFLAAMPERYIAFIDRDGVAAALRGKDGRLIMVGTVNRFLAEQWSRADGDERSADALFAGKKSGGRCDRLGCVGEGIVTIAIVKDPLALREDCQRADIVVSRYEIPSSCAARVAIDGATLRAKGAAAIRLMRDGRLEVLHAREEGMNWPWLPHLNTSR